MKNAKKFLVLIVFLVICLGSFFLLQGKESSFHPDYTLSLPEGFVLEPDSKTGNASILQNGSVIGGVLNCPYSREYLNSTDPVDQIHSGNFYMHSETIIETLDAADTPGGSLESFDRMIESSVYADCQAWFGNAAQEYQYYLYFFEEGILTLWFDLSLVDIDTANNIVAAFSVAR